MFFLLQCFLIAIHNMKTPIPFVHTFLSSLIAKYSVAEYSCADLDDFLQSKSNGVRIFSFKIRQPPSTSCIIELKNNHIE